VSAPAPGQALSGELASIQALRFFAAFVVVVYHGGVAGSVHGFLGPQWDDLLRLSEVGKAGVHIFFVISGFIMVYATRGHRRDLSGAATFLRRRFLRIYPVYWLYAALYLAFHVLVLQTYGRGWEEVLLALLLWPGYSEGIIGPGWTLSYEVYFYLAFGLCFCLRPFASLVTLSLGLCGMIALGVLVDLPERPWGVLTNPLLLEFLAGAWAARLIMLGRVPGWLGDAALLAGLVGFAAGIAAGLPPIPTVVLWGVPSLLLVGGLAAREASGRLPAGFRRLRALGDGSYSLYLLHTLVLDIVLMAAVALGAGGLGAAPVLAAILVSCLVGQAAYAMIERPFFEALRSRRRRAAAPMAA
jgi:exopolysaccharide production protein ExoZ